jgi:hypothetical protein
LTDARAPGGDEEFARASRRAMLGLVLVFVAIGIAIAFFIMRPRASYPAVVQRNFLASCERNGGSDASCRCALSKVQRRYTYDQFAQIERDTNEGRAAPEGFVAIARECAAR